MIHQAYVIYDSCAKLYNKPFYFISDEVALRSAREILKSNQHQISDSPSDFTMFKIGEYDDESGELQLTLERTVICRFHEIAESMLRKNEL